MRRSALSLLLVPVLAVGSAQARPVARFVRCHGAAAGARCGYVTVPLDRSGHIRGTLRIGFELYPRRLRRQPSLGTIVDVQGGPGYSTTDSRDEYLTLDRPLLARRQVLLVDQRGTGLSHPLACRAFAHTETSYDRRAGACARQIGRTVGLYDTHAAVDDLAAVLTALRTGPIDLYGDSYGSYLAQAFAVRYPHLLRSLVLDGTYPLPGTDPALSDLARATQSAFGLVCQRWPSCSSAHIDPLGVIASLLRRVRRRPIVGVGVDADGARQSVRITEHSLVDIAQGAEANITVYRDLVGAIRSYDAGDRAPLLRLAAENVLDFSASDPRSFSEALYLAVTCHDYPQMWNPSAPLAQRRTQLAAWRARLQPAAFYPFSGRAWTSGPYEGADACLLWPGPLRSDPPIPAGARYPRVPTLILDGDLDNITTTADAAVVARRFRGSTFVRVHNMIHISALGDLDQCGSLLVRRFVQKLSAGDTSCAAHIEEVRMVDRFPLVAARTAPAVPLPGNRASLLDRRVAAAAAATVADSLQRWLINYSGSDRGLRGGRWSYSGDDIVHFKFADARFVRDVTVSGTATWRTITGPLTASVSVRGPTGLRGHLTVAWNVQGSLSMARLVGVVGRRRLVARMLAP